MERVYACLWISLVSISDSYQLPDSPLAFNSHCVSLWAQGRSQRSELAQSLTHWLAERELMRVSHSTRDSLLLSTEQLIILLLHL